MACGPIPDIRVLSGDRAVISGQANYVEVSPSRSVGFTGADSGSPRLANTASVGKIPHSGDNAEDL